MLCGCIVLIPIYIRRGWPPRMQNDLICNLHQTYSAVSVIHIMLKQNCKMCKLMRICPKQSLYLFRNLYQVRWVISGLVHAKSGFLLKVENYFKWFWLLIMTFNPTEYILIFSEFSFFAKSGSPIQNHHQNHPPPLIQYWCVSGLLHHIIYLDTIKLSN